MLVFDLPCFLWIKICTNILSQTADLWKLNSSLTRIFLVFFGIYRQCFMNNDLNLRLFNELCYSMNKICAEYDMQKISPIAYVFFFLSNCLSFLHQKLVKQCMLFNSKHVLNSEKKQKSQKSAEQQCLQRWVYQFLAVHEIH